MTCGSSIGCFAQLWVRPRGTHTVGTRISSPIKSASPPPVPGLAKGGGDKSSGPDPQTRICPDPHPLPRICQDGTQGDRGGPAEICEPEAVCDQLSGLQTLRALGPDDRPFRPQWPPIHPLARAEAGDPGSCIPGEKAQANRRRTNRSSSSRLCTWPSSRAYKSEFRISR